MNEHEWDDDDDDASHDEDSTALRAVQAWLEVDGDDEFAQASRDALVALAQQALGMKDARQRREAAERRAEAHRERERRADRERAEARERAEWWEAERRAREERLAAVEREHRAEQQRAEARERAARQEAERQARDARLAAAERERRAERERAAARDRAGRRDGEHHQASDFRRPVVERSHTRPLERPIQAAPALSARKEPAPPAVPARPMRRVEVPPVVVAAVEPEDPEVDGAEPSAVTTAREVGWEQFEAGPIARAPDEPARVSIGGAASALTGADLAAWRTRHGLTQQAAADRLGVRQGTVSKAESRGVGALGPALREALAGVLAEERGAA